MTEKDCEAKTWGFEKLNETPVNSTKEKRR